MQTGILNSDVLVLVDFGQHGAVHPVASKSTVENLLWNISRYFKVVKINTDDYEEIADQYGIRKLSRIRYLIKGRAVESFITPSKKNIFGNLSIKPFIHAIN